MCAPGALALFRSLIRQGIYLAVYAHPYVKFLDVTGATQFMRTDRRLARRDLAAMIGIRPDTMCRAIKPLEEDGVAYFSGRSVPVPDVKRRLREIEPEGYL